MQPELEREPHLLEVVAERRNRFRGDSPRRGLPLPIAEHDGFDPGRLLALPRQRPPSRLDQSTSHRRGRVNVHDGPRVYGGWIIHRANYRAPKVLDVARLQAWTLKPAISAGSKN